MPKLTVDDLNRIKEEHKAMLTVREGGSRGKVTVHMGTCGIASGARRIMQALIEEIDKHNIRDLIITTSGCAGLCSREPMVTVEMLNEAPVKYVQLNEEKMRKIVQEHIIKNNIVTECAFVRGSESAY